MLMAILFLGVLAKLRKSLISFVMSVRQSVRMKQLGSHWKNIHKILISEKFLKICPENSSFIKLGQEYRVLYMNANKHF